MRSNRAVIPQWHLPNPSGARRHDIAGQFALRWREIRAIESGGMDPKYSDLGADSWLAVPMFGEIETGGKWDSIGGAGPFGLSIGPEACRAVHNRRAVRSRDGSVIEERSQPRLREAR